MVDGPRRPPRPLRPADRARRRSTTACAAPSPSPSAWASSDPEWELAADRIVEAIVHRPGSFAPKDRWAMDWYYPVLSGRAVRRAGRASGSTAAGPSSCSTVSACGASSDQPWVTAAETAECVMALDAVGLRDQADGAARLDAAPARRRRRLLDGLRAPRVRALSGRRAQHLHRRRRPARRPRPLRVRPERRAVPGRDAPGRGRRVGVREPLGEG